MNKKEQIGLLINKFVKNTLLEKWSENNGEEFPDVFRVEISLCPMKVVKISDRYEVTEQLDIDNHFKKVDDYTYLNIEDDIICKDTGEILNI